MAASACAPAPASSIIPASMSMPIATSASRRWSTCSGILGWQDHRYWTERNDLRVFYSQNRYPTLAEHALTEHILQPAFADNGHIVQFDRRSHHRKIEMPGGVAASEFVGAGGKQEVAGNRTQFGAIGVALIVHRQRLVGG